MEQYDRQTLRGLREEMDRKKREKRGSFFVTIIILLIFLGAGAFYIKTSKPELWQNTINRIKTLASSTVQTVQNPNGESGEMLKDAHNINFDYLTEDIEVALLSNTVKTFISPLKSFTVTSDYGIRTDPVTREQNASHHGIDLAAAKGSEIYALADGTVTFAGYTEIYGNCIKITHDSGLTTFYGHMSSLKVKTNDDVKAGQSIGIIGSTGKSTGIHLHFEVLKNGSQVDPKPYLYEKI